MSRSDPRPPRLALIVNVGSSSLRLAAYSLADTPVCVATAHWSPAPKPSLSVLTGLIKEHTLGQPDIVVHRVVHGGLHLRQSCLITPSVIAEIDRFTSLAPRHNAAALEWMEIVRAVFDERTVQGACFDTAFYRAMPAQAADYALPADLCETHALKRYGFHGLAHQSLLSYWYTETDAHGDQRVISLQLGSGCSVTATCKGWPVETSMGFSPAEGLMMGTRAGSVDAALVLYLIEHGGYSPSELGRMLNDASGLLGVSGESADMQTLLASGSETAERAIAMFCHRLRHYVGAYLAHLGGVDAIVFGGGIGQHAPDIRARALDRLEWAGIAVDATRNAAVSPSRGGPIHADDSRVQIWVAPTDEAGVMARCALQLLTPPLAASADKDVS